MVPRILSYPPRHPYVDRLHGPVATLVERNQAMPKIPNYYDVEWIKRNSHLWDIVHFHFGWEQYAIEQVEQVVSMHQKLGKPIVVTVHDTRNPHTVDAANDKKYIRLLLSKAASVITLTGSAQRYIIDNYNIDPIVIPHGPLLGREEMNKYRSLARNERIIYVHVKSGRSNLDYQRIITMAPDIERISGYKMIFGIHRNSPAHEYVKKTGERHWKYIELQGELSHDELCVKIATVTVVLMPYLWGSHSGLIELAKDLGTTSLIYDTGHFDDQSPTFTLPYQSDAIQQRNAITEVLRQVDRRHFSLPTVNDRMEELDQYLDDHKMIYERVRAL